MNHSKLTRDMEQFVLNSWHGGWAVFRIRRELGNLFPGGRDVTPSMIYNLLTKARKRGDRRATRRHTDMVVNAS